MKVLSLPDVAFRTLITYLGPEEIFLFSTCSMNARKKIRLVSRTHSAETCVVDLNSSYLGFKIHFKNKDYTAHWQLSLKPCRYDQFERADELKELNIDGVRLMGYFGRKYEIFCEDVIETFKYLLNYMISIFSVPLDICIRPGLPEVKDILAMTHFATCDKLSIERGYQPDSFAKEELEDIFGRVQSFRVLNFDVNVNFRFDEVFKAKILYLGNASWMNSGDFPRFENIEEALIEQSNFTNQDIEDFVKNWLSRETIPLTCRLYINWTNGLPEFANVKKFSWNPAKRSKTCLRSDLLDALIDFENAIDFERADGTIASIALKSSQLLFHVWRNPFPTREEETQLRKEIEDMYSLFPNINRTFGLDHHLENVLLDKRLSVEVFEEYKLEVVTIREQEISDNWNHWLRFVNHLGNTRKRLFQLTNSVF